MCKYQHNRGIWWAFTVFGPLLTEPHLHNGIYIFPYLIQLDIIYLHSFVSWNVKSGWFCSLHLLNPMKQKVYNKHCTLMSICFGTVHIKKHGKQNQLISFKHSWCEIVHWWHRLKIRQISFTYFSWTCWWCNPFPTGCCWHRNLGTECYVHRFVILLASHTRIQICKITKLCKCTSQNCLPSVDIHKV